MMGFKPGLEYTTDKCVKLNKHMVTNYSADAPILVRFHFLSKCTTRNNDNLFSLDEACIILE